MAKSGCWPAKRVGENARRRQLETTNPAQSRRQHRKPSDGTVCPTLLGRMAKNRTECPTSARRMPADSPVGPHLPDRIPVNRPVGGHPLNQMPADSPEDPHPAGQMPPFGIEDPHSVEPMPPFGIENRPLAQNAFLAGTDRPQFCAMKTGASLVDHARRDPSRNDAIGVGERTPLACGFRCPAGNFDLPFSFRPAVRRKMVERSRGRDGHDSTRDACAPRFNCTVPGRAETTGNCSNPDRRIKAPVS